VTANGNWTQLLTLAAVVLGGLITMSTTWLANLQQSSTRARERREDRLMPLYLNLHLAIRDLVRLLEAYVLAGFPKDESAERESEIRSAYDALYRLGYKIDFMSPLEVVIHNERVEDSLTRLIESIGFRVGLTPIPAIEQTRSEDHVRSELRAISELRMRLLKAMQDDLALTGGQRRRWHSYQGIIRRLRSQEYDEALDHYVRRGRTGLPIDD
jgi:hypothetical protein